ncbi:hypothetical protein GCM10027429_14970 [Marivirga atlantica]|jgi:hypothetical protein|uniref:Magnesium citrate secondary transporter n=1 Tax=Marivirga atlantica TaxID=1548457 RepID=A0A937AGF9_9BACT|nr:hypothetical protein [Marivirga atlantica]MBL0765114.1 hypothetical protein [Marivirga atlantica]
MKKILFHYGFIIPVLAFTIHQVLEIIFEIHIPFLDNYLDPFCAGAIMLHALAIERKVILDNKLTYLDVVIAIVLLSIIVEVLFPYLSSRFTADIYDLLSFITGGIWFLLTRGDLLIRTYKRE